MGRRQFEAVCAIVRPAHLLRSMRLQRLWLPLPLLVVLLMAAAQAPAPVAAAAAPPATRAAGVPRGQCASSTPGAAVWNACLSCVVGFCPRGCCAAPVPAPSSSDAVAARTWVVCKTAGCCVRVYVETSGKIVALENSAERTDGDSREIPRANSAPLQASAVACGNISVVYNGSCGQVCATLLEPPSPSGMLARRNCNNGILLPAYDQPYHDGTAACAPSQSLRAPDTRTPAIIGYAILFGAMGLYFMSLLLHLVAAAVTPTYRNSPTK
jgi:hypothetical protein